MPSTFTRISPNSGGGNQLPGDHIDAVVEVLQVETSGGFLSPESERASSISISLAALQGGPPSGAIFATLVLDNIEVTRYQESESALLWRFQYSNDKFFNLGTIAGGASAQSGIWNQSTSDVQRIIPLVLQSLRVVGTLPGGFPDLELSETPFNRAIVEQESVWEIRCTSTSWNQATAIDVMRRVGDMHTINGNLYEFRGAQSVRRLSGTEYEIVYRWIIDPGTISVDVRSNQPPQGDRILVPPVVASGDPSLTTPFGDTFQADFYKRLPFHEIEIIATPDGQQSLWTWRQVSFKTWLNSRKNDWQALPGNPIGTL